MKRGLPLFAIGLLFGGLIGFLLAAGNGITFDGHDHTDPAQHTQEGMAAHSHGLLPPISIDAAAMPILAMTVQRDPAGGLNIELTTENFRFAPENASTAHVAGEGHAHIYVNGAKAARHYGGWIHVPDIPAGPLEIRAVLYSNDHRPLLQDGAAIETVVAIGA